MITSELKDGVVWLTAEGKLEAEEVQREVGKWLAQKDTFSGFITDLRGLTTIPSMEEQKRLEAWREQNKSGKPHALLGRTNALGVLVTIYATDWQLGLAFAAFAGLTLVTLSWVRRFATPYWKESRERSAATYGYLGELLTAMEDIRSCGAVPSARVR